MFSKNVYITLKKIYTKAFLECYSETFSEHLQNVYITLHKRFCVSWVVIEIKDVRQDGTIVSSHSLEN